MEMTTAVRNLAALAHEHRLGVFRLLVKSGPQGLPAGEIAAALALPPSSLSFHLAALESAGLVASSRAGRFILYRVEPDAIRELLAYLTEDCCEGRPELCAGTPGCPSGAESTPAGAKTGRATT
jgi:ArsR family transcriptional regulator, arsenate/arsenite/antimonite-responsive transcriptional repressor